MKVTANLQLCVTSSALPYGVILSSGGEILFDSTQHEALQKLKDVPALVNHALRAIDRPARDLEVIAVNQGPGGTSAIRAGVAFVNSLAYSLGIPVITINAFELMGEPASRKYGCPVLTTVKSVRGNAYVGWYADGALRATQYGPLETTVRRVVGDCREWAVTGAHREQLQELFPACKVHDTGHKFGSALDMVPLLPKLRDRELVFPRFVVPITEQSTIFSEHED